MKKRLTIISIVVLIVITATVLIVLFTREDINKVSISETIAYIKDNQVYKRSSDWTSEENLYSAKGTERLSNLKGNGHYIAFSNGVNLIIFNLNNSQLKTINDNPEDFTWIKSESSIIYVIGTKLYTYSLAEDKTVVQDISSLPNISELTNKIYSIKSSFDGKYIQINNKIIDLENNNFLEGQYPVNTVWSTDQYRFANAVSLQDMGGLYDYVIQGDTITKFRYPDNVTLNADSVAFAKGGNLIYTLGNSISLLNTTNKKITNKVIYGELSTNMDLLFQSKSDSSFVAIVSIGNAKYKVQNLALDARIKTPVFEVNEVTWLD